MQMVQLVNLGFESGKITITCEHDHYFAKIDCINLLEVDSESLKLIEKSD